MIQITASQVNMLRKQTGAGMMDCKNALVETNGDFEKAIDALRKKGQKVAAKRADRETTEGVVLGMVSTAKSSKNIGSKGAILALNCETDFVAKNESFVGLAKSFLKLALESEANDIEGIKALPFDEQMSIQEKLIEQTGVIGEKLELSHYHVIGASAVATYIHPGNKLVSLVGFNTSYENGTPSSWCTEREGEETMQEVGKNIAMQIAAMNPIGIAESDVSQDVIDKEIEIGKDLARQEGKPEEMLEKISMGRLKKFFKENTLINQNYIKDSKKTVLQYLNDTKEGLNVVEFKRVNLG